MVARLFLFSKKMTLRTGTCSWKYDSWVGLVYPAKEKEQYLTEYSKHFDTVEVDQSFWSLFDNSKPKLPQPSGVKSYLEAVPPGFKFSVKVPNSITLTHYYQKNKSTPLKENPYFLSAELFQVFLERLEPMKNHLGPLMFQFEYLNKKKVPDRAQFLDKLAAFRASCPQADEYQWAIETRNPNYLDETYFDFLKQNKLYHVFVQGYYMPPVFSVYSQYARWIEELTIIRLMGPDRKAIEQKSGKKWDTVVDAKDEELEEIVKMIHHLEERKMLKS